MAGKCNVATVELPNFIYYHRRLFSNFAEFSYILVWQTPQDSAEAQTNVLMS